MECSKISNQHSQVLRKSSSKLSATDRLEAANQLLIAAPKQAETLCQIVLKDKNLSADLQLAAQDLLDQVDISHSLLVATQWLEYDGIDYTKKAKTICLEILDKQPLDSRIEEKVTQLLVAVEDEISRYLLVEIQHSFQEERPSTYLETRKIGIEILNNKNLNEEDKKSTNEKLDRVVALIEQTLNKHRQEERWEFPAMEIMIFCKNVLAEQALAAHIHEVAKQLLSQAEKRAMGEMVISLVCGEHPYDIENTYQQIQANQPNDPDIVQLAAEIKKCLLGRKLNQAERDFSNGHHSPKWIKEFCQRILNDQDGLPDEIQQKANDLLDMANNNVNVYIQQVMTSANSFLSLDNEDRRINTINNLIGLLQDCSNDLKMSDYLEINRLLVYLQMQNAEEQTHFIGKDRQITYKYVGFGPLIKQLYDVAIAINAYQKIQEAHVRLAQSKPLSDQRILHLAIASEMGSVESSFELAKVYEANEMRMPILDHIPEGTTAARYYNKKADKQAGDQQNNDFALVNCNHT